MVEVRHISAVDGAADEKDDAPFDAGDPKAVKAAIKDARQAEATSVETLKWMMGEEKGRKWFYDLLSSCHLLHNPFSSEPLRMSFNCGELNIGLQVFSQLQENCPDLYLLMMKEAKERANG